MKRKSFTFFSICFFILFNGVVYCQEFEMPSFVHAIDACDIDMDGSKDIIVSCGYEDTLVILFNDGDGNFEPYNYNRITGSAICGCVDEDSIPDIIAGKGQMYFYKSYGDRSIGFGDPLMVFSGTFYLYDLLDMNNDGWNDLFYQLYTNAHWGFMENNGNLSFSDKIIYYGNSTKPDIGNLNADNLPDLVFSFPDPTSETQVYINNGNFIFSTLSIIDKIISDPIILESNNSSPEDLVLFETPTANVYFYENLGNANFEFRGNNPLIDVYAVVLTDHNDYNNDGYGDICYCQCPITGCNDSIYIAINSHDWSFNEGQSYFVGTLNWFRLISTDMNADHFPDLIMTGYNSNNKIKILWNNGDGTFSYTNPVMILENDVKYSITLKVNPNPFSNYTKIVIKLNQPSVISLKIINIFGQEESSLINNQKLNEGEFSYNWNGKDSSGSNCPPGIYILVLERNGNIYSQKIILY